MALTGFVGRNGLAGWKLLATNPALFLAEQKLMREHMRRETRCSVCGTTKKLECHHTTPLWKSIQQAGEPAINVNGEQTCRFMALCRPCHLRWAHDFNYGEKYVANISIIAACIREVQRSAKVVRRE